MSVMKNSESAIWLLRPIFVEHPPPVFDQHGQRIKHLRLEQQRLPVAQQEVVQRIHAERAELVEARAHVGRDEPLERLTPIEDFCTESK